MITDLLTKPRRALHWLSRMRRTGSAARRVHRRRRTIVAETQGRALLMDCQRHPQGWWSGVVTLREAEQVRVVHVCSELRPSAQEALGDAEREGQRLALMFAQ